MKTIDQLNQERWQQVAEGVDSILAPITYPCARNKWEPVPITDLGPPEPIDWVWEGVIAKGQVTLLTAMWKSGKTTLIGYLLRDIGRGSGLVRVPLGIKVLVISEENEDHWRHRCQQLGLTSDVHVILRPFAGKPTLKEWTDFVLNTSERVRQHGYGLVVFDTLASLWSVINENDASEVTAALLPINSITDLHTAVAILHHPRKSMGDDSHGTGQTSRGSGALPSFADLLVDMTRYDASDPKDCRRVLYTSGRSIDPGEIVLELGDAGYTILGNKAETTREERMSILSAMMSQAGDGWKPEAFRENWPTKPAPSLRTLQGDLADGATSGRWRKVGDGKRNSPFLYRSKELDSRTHTPLGACGETNPNNQTGGDQ